MSDSAARVGWLHRVGTLSRHRYATLLLFAIAFADSSFLPVMPDLLLVPMILFRPERLRALLVICTIASSLGAALGYVIGYGLWNVVGSPLVEFWGYTEAFATGRRLVAEWGVWIIVVKAFTPIPFKIAAIAAGASEMNPVAFMIATVVGRAVHFAMVGGLVVLCGGRVMVLMARYERRIAILSIVVLIAAIIVYQLW